jgi:hypothetical protein
VRWDVHDREATWREHTPNLVEHAVVLGNVLGHVEEEQPVDAP